MASVVEALPPRCQVPHSASPVSASLASPSGITDLWASEGWLSGSDGPEIVGRCRLEWLEVRQQRDRWQDKLVPGVFRIKKWFDLIAELRCCCSWWKGRVRGNGFCQRKKSFNSDVKIFNNLYFSLIHTQLSDHIYSYHPVIPNKCICTDWLREEILG